MTPPIASCITSDRFVYPSDMQNNGKVPGPDAKTADRAAVDHALEHWPLRSYCT
jgi:hypothetical protein